VGFEHEMSRQLSLQSKYDARELRVLAINGEDWRARRTDISACTCQKSLTRTRSRQNAVREWIRQIRNEGQAGIVRRHERRRTCKASLQRIGRSFNLMRCHEDAEASAPHGLLVHRVRDAYAR